jgi:hypothetical protein
MRQEALCRHARAHFAAARDVDDGTLRDVVAEAIERATAAGMRSEQSLYCFINLVVEYGADFDSDPELAWMREYLDDPDVPDPDERLARLHTAVLVRREREGAGDLEEQEEGDERDERE